jgi:ribose 5-phosphate isomerase A
MNESEGGSMSQELRKRRAAEAALEYIEPGTVLGMGTGSTVNQLIGLLPGISGRIDGALASSRETDRRLREAGVRVLDPNEVGPFPVFIDGADESDPGLRLIKGGGGALTREKILASLAERFVCIADESKLVERLGSFPLPIEVIPMGRTAAALQIEDLGGHPALREGFETDNGNLILDVRGLEYEDPAALETTLNQVVGAVSNGLFARRGADVLLLGKEDGVRKLP